MRKRIVVIDATGGSSRPVEEAGQGFGVGAIIFSDSLQQDLANAARKIARTVNNSDFKYKHVQKSTEARKLFITTITGFAKKIGLYAFYSCDSGVAREIERTKEAAKIYGTTATIGSTSSTATLLEQFIGYMVLQLGRHAETNNYFAEIHWDKRTDLDFVKERCNHYIALSKTEPSFSGIEKHIAFAGQATGPLSQIAKLAGVLAGDIRQFFNSHGSKVWKHFDTGGLRQEKDPHLARPRTHSLPLMATITEPLADVDSLTGSTDTVMLQGYYKSFLQHDQTKHHLISFGDPYGCLGILGIEHGKRWHVYQLPD